MIYLDNAATTIQKPQAVIDAVVSAMCSMGNAGRGVNDASLGAARVIYETREKLNRLFHGENPKQIAFTSNSTESLNIAIKGTLAPGDHVITTALEHNSVLRPLYELEETGVEAFWYTGSRTGSSVLERHRPRPAPTRIGSVSSRVTVMVPSHQLDRRFTLASILRKLTRLSCVTGRPVISI